MRRATCARRVGINVTRVRGDKWRNEAMTIASAVRNVRKTESARALRRRWLARPDAPRLLA